MTDEPTPDGKRALFSKTPGSRGAADGKNALFSAASGEESDGPLAIDCARCGVSTQVTVTEAVKRLLKFSWWIPGRTYSRRLACPACGKRSWVRIRLA